MVRDPAFATDDGTPFSVHTRWIETEFHNTIPAYTPDGSAGAATVQPDRERVTVEVGGRRLEVVLPAGLGAGARPARELPRPAMR